MTARLDADVIREVLDELEYGDTEAHAALDRMTARVHSLERALGEIAASGDGESREATHAWIKEFVGDYAYAHDLATDLWDIIDLAARAVVLEGREHDKQQEQDSGGNVNVASGAEQESQR